MHLLAMSLLPLSTGPSELHENARDTEKLKPHSKGTDLDDLNLISGKLVCFLCKCPFNS